MSGIGNPKVGSILPEDIEQKLSEIQGVIASLNEQKIALEKDIIDRSNTLNDLIKKVEIANDEYKKISAQSSAILEEIKKREDDIAAEKEGLRMFAEGLKVKEERINKYLAVFEGIKANIGK